MTRTLSSGVIAASELLRSGPPAWAGWGTFAAELRFEDLPSEVVDRTKLVLLDCIGAIIAGAQEPEMAAFGRSLKARSGGGGGAVAIGQGIDLPPPLAALANGTAGTMLELDEGNQFCRGHPGIHVVPAILASVSGTPVSGRDLLVAIVLGYEIGARIGIASKLRVTMHPHGTWGTVGAALAVASLAGASASRIVETINVASSLGLGTSRRTMLEGGTVRNVYAGVSNQLGMIAADLAASGFVGERDGLATVFGTVVAEDFDPAAMTEELGTRYEIARNYFKRHAACRYTHGALDALETIVLRAGGPLDPASVEAIEVETYLWAAQLDSAEPRNMLAAKFSLPFALATTILHGAATVPAFREPAVADPAVRDLARRVTVREDPALTAALPHLRPARVTVRLADGRALAAEARTNRGDTEDPYSADEVVAKFGDLAGPVWGGRHAQAIVSAVDRIETGDTAALLDLLGRQPLSTEAVAA